MIPPAKQPVLSACHHGTLAATLSSEPFAANAKALCETPLGGGVTFDGLEAECHRTLVGKLGEPRHAGTIFIPAEILYRDLNTAVAGTGGYLVGAVNVSFIDALRNVALAYRVGVQRMPNQRENLTFPRQTDSATVAWLNTETTPATESTLTFGQVAGAPHTASVYTEISHQLLEQSNPAVEGVVTTGFAKDLAVAVDGAVFTGSGANGQPLGIIGTAGIGGVTGTSLGYAGLVEAQTDIANSNAIVNPTSLAHVTTPAVAQLLKGRQRFTGTDSPLWRGAIHEGEIEGVRAFSTKQMPTASMLYGDFSSVIVVEWGVLALEVNPFSDFKAGIVGVRGLWSIDVLVLHPASFTLISSIT